MAQSSCSFMGRSKPVVVRVKRKPFQSPLDAFWLEIINDRPLKRPLSDFRNLSISDSSQNGLEINDRPLKRPLLDFKNLSISDSSQNVEFNNKVLVQHVETISSSEVTLDIVQSFVEPSSKNVSESKSKVEERKNFFKKVNKQDQRLFKAKQEKESSAKDARFKQIWKSRKVNNGTADENALQEICQFYDIVRVDSEEKTMEVQQEDISLEDQRLLSSFLPLMREVIPNAAAEIEADISGQSKQEDYVYDLYTVTDKMIIEEVSSHSYPIVQVDDEDFYDGPDNSDYETDDSNAEDNPMNDYPDEMSEEDEEEDGSSKSESDKSKSDRSNNELLIDEDFVEYKGATADPLYDEDFDFDDYEEDIDNEDDYDDYSCDDV